MIVFTISILFISIFFTGCGTTTQTQTKSGLTINGWSSEIGGVNETNLDKTNYSYSINLTNENENTVFIESVEPRINEKYLNITISKDIIVSVNKDLKPKESIQINGEIIFDTNGLTKSDILNLEPFITDIKVLSEEIVSLNR